MPYGQSPPPLSAYIPASLSYEPHLLEMGVPFDGEHLDFFQQLRQGDVELALALAGLGGEVAHEVTASR